MQLWLLGPLYAWLLPGVLCWNKRISANLRNIAYAPERDYEWTRTAETKYYKRGGQTQVSPGNIPYFGLPKEESTSDDEGEVDKSADSEAAKRAWAGPGDIGFYKRANVGSFGFYKRLHEAEDKKNNPGTFSYYKKAGPGSFGMYKRGNPGSFGFYKRGNPESFGSYGKRGGPGAFAFYKRANPGEFGMYKRGSPADFGMYKRANPGSFGLYKRAAEKDRRARPGDVPIWKRGERSTDEQIVDGGSQDIESVHRIQKRSVGDFGFYKKNVKSDAKHEDNKDLTKEIENVGSKHAETEQGAIQGEEKKSASCYHVFSFRCRQFYGNEPRCYHGGIGPRVSRDSNGVLWCECACPERWSGAECRVATSASP